MDADQIEDFISQYLLEHGPSKYNEVLVDVLVQIKEDSGDIDDHEFVPSVINNAINKGLIVAVSYVLPTSDYRERTILFPKGTEVRIWVDSSTE